MGFRTGAWAKVWAVEQKSSTWTKCRISISRRNKQTGEYEPDFSGFADFTGTAAAAKAAELHEGDSIRLGDVDVVRVWDKERQKEYINFKVFSFEIDGQQNPARQVDGNTVEGTVEEGGFLDIPDEESPW